MKSSFRLIVTVFLAFGIHNILYAIIMLCQPLNPCGVRAPDFSAPDSDFWVYERSRDLNYEYQNIPSNKTKDGLCALADDFTTDDWTPIPAVSPTVRMWKKGTGPNGDPNGTLDQCFIVNPIKNKSKQQVWLESMGIDGPGYYRFSFYAANVWNTTYSATAHEPEIALFAKDRTSPNRQLPLYQTEWDPNLNQLGTRSANTTYTRILATNTPDYNLSGLPWVKLETPWFFIDPYTFTASNNQTCYQAVVELRVLDSKNEGDDFALDKFCLEKHGCSDLSVPDICKTDNLIATYTPPTGTSLTVTSWEIDGTTVTPTPPANSINLSPGSILGPIYHNLTSGRHGVKAILSDGSSCIQFVRVFDYDPADVQLNFTWVDNSTAIELDPTHKGSAVTFKEYPSQIDMDNDVNGTVINPIASGPNAGKYRVTMGTTKYICKIVDYPCATGVRDCAAICASPYGMVINVTGETYNSGTGQYDVDFSLTNTDPTVYKYTWHFGDNSQPSTTTGATTTMSHSFDDEGEYEIEVVGFRPEPCPRSTDDHLLTLCPSSQDDVLPDISICAGNSYTFDADPNSNDYAELTYEWYVAGEKLGTSSTQNTGTLRRPGEYKIKVVKRTKCGDPVELTSTLTVLEHPYADFSWGMKEDNGLEVKFTAKKYDPNNTYEWKNITTPGLAAFHVGETTILPFPTGDNYTIQLTVTGPAPTSCVNVIQKNICVAEKPTDCCNCDATP